MSVPSAPLSFELTPDLAHLKIRVDFPNPRTNVPTLFLRCNNSEIPVSYLSGLNEALGAAQQLVQDQAGERRGVSPP
jgi:hypothetical protein